MATETTYAPQVRSVGLDGVLVTFGDRATDAANRAAIAFRSAVDALAWPDVSESSSTLVSAFFRVDLSSVRFEEFRDQLLDVLNTRDWFAEPLPAGRALWTIPAVFGGERAPQFGEAADAAGLSEQDALQHLTQTRLRVLTLGFAPGQPYLGTLGEAWNIPRQKELTPNVPTGALVAAVRQICLFAKDTPTGWRHVG
ncbi:MAG: allophanate hydrolase subunit 1, partial [Tateyamaria sp.]